MDAVNKTVKRQSKGEQWYQTGVAMKGARDEIKEEYRLDKIEFNKVQVLGATSDVTSVVSLATSSKGSGKVPYYRKQNPLDGDW